jgi:hypothetical protein
LVTCSVCLFPSGLDSDFECVLGLTQLKILFAPSSMVSVATSHTSYVLFGFAICVGQLELVLSYSSSFAWSEHLSPGRFGSSVAARSSWWLFSDIASGATHCSCPSSRLGIRPLLYGRLWLHPTFSLLLFSSAFRHDTSFRFFGACVTTYRFFSFYTYGLKSFFPSSDLLNFKANLRLLVCTVSLCLFVSLIVLYCLVGTANTYFQRFVEVIDGFGLSFYWLAFIPLVL